MVALSVKSTKNIMGALLMTEAFDDFEVCEVTITTFNTFSIDGHIEKNFYTSEEINDMQEGLPIFSSWKDIRPICFSLIKGKKTPVSFKFILQANSRLIDELCSNAEVTVQRDLIKGLVLNIKYEEGRVNLVSACSYKTFTMDKSLDEAWDKYLPQLLNKLKLDYEEI